MRSVNERECRPTPNNLTDEGDGMFAPCRPTIRLLSTLLSSKTMA